MHALIILIEVKPYHTQFWGFLQNT